MKHIRVKDEQEMNTRAAQILIAQVLLKEDAVLGLATGGTPEGVYAKMAEAYKNGSVSFEKVRTVNLDEYVGLNGDHPQSYRYYMEDNLFSKVDIEKENTHLPNGTATDLMKECADYDALVKSLGGVDMQLLGIGNNGHIGFNEPGDAFVMGTNVVTLSQNTIDANARYFDDMSKVPKKALTLGIRGIMSAKKVLLIAGASKRDIIEKAFYGPVTPSVPASILQLHPDAIIISC